jgi:hypothetical protein
MFLKIVTIVFYAGLALFFFGVGFPFLEIILGIAAAILAIAHL